MSKTVKVAIISNKFEDKNKTLSSLLNSIVLCLFSILSQIQAEIYFLLYSN